MLSRVRRLEQNSYLLLYEGKYFSLYYFLKVFLKDLVPVTVYNFSHFLGPSRLQRVPMEEGQ